MRCLLIEIVQWQLSNIKKFSRPTAQVHSHLFRQKYRISKHALDSFCGVRGAVFGAWCSLCPFIRWHQFIRSLVMNKVPGSEPMAVLISCAAQLVAFWGTYDQGVRNEASELGVNMEMKGDVTPLMDRCVHLKMRSLPVYIAG